MSCRHLAQAKSAGWGPYGLSLLLSGYQPYSADLRFRFTSPAIAARRPYNRPCLAPRVLPSAHRGKRLRWRHYSSPSRRKPRRRGPLFKEGPIPPRVLPLAHRRLQVRPKVNPQTPNAERAQAGNASIGRTPSGGALHARRSKPLCFPSSVRSGSRPCRLGINPASHVIERGVLCARAPFPLHQRGRHRRLLKRLKGKRSRPAQ